MIDLGWTRDQVLDQVDIPFLKALREEWRQAPPLRRLAAGYVGWKAPRKLSTGADIVPLPHFA